MGLMTLEEFRDELTFLLKNRTDATVIPARLNRIINQAYSHLCQPEVRKHKELIAHDDVTLVDGQVGYAIQTLFATDILSIEDVVYVEAAAWSNTAARSDLEPRAIHWMNARTHPAGGRPTIYALYGTELIIYPEPSTVEAGNIIRVWYYTEPTVLVNNTDTTELATYWDRVLLRGAQWLLEYDAGFRELALLTEQEYTSMINEKKDDFELSEVDGSRADFKTQRYF